MNDRELLELAAKGAGYWVEQCREDDEVHVKTWAHGNYSKWNPLEDDGDAIRAATSAGLSIERRKFSISVSETPDENWLDDDLGEILATESVGVGSLCPHKATRRAIVRGLAVIGGRS